MNGSNIISPRQQIMTDNWTKTSLIFAYLLIYIFFGLINTYTNEINISITEQIEYEINIGKLETPFPIIRW
jgi:hypothetical protein